MKPRTTVLVALLTSGLTASGQVDRRTALVWERSKAPPFGGMIQTIVETTSGTLIAAAISGLYKSTDDGRTWIACRALPQQASGLTRRPALAMIGRDIYATGYGDDLVLVTDDTCDKYEMRMLGAGGSSATRETALASTATGVLIVAREEGTVFSSPDGGRHWNQSFVGANGPPRLAVTGRGTVLLAAGGQRLYRSVDQGVSWTPTVVPEPIWPSVETGFGLFAIGLRNSWRSADDGLTWAPANHAPRMTLRAQGDTVYGVDDTGERTIARSRDGGRSWSRLRLPAPRTSPYGLIETRTGSVIAATHDGIFRTLDDGITWHHVGVQHENIKVLEAEPGRAIAIGEGGSVWSSADADSWVRMPSPSVPIRDRVRGSVQLSGILLPGDGRLFGLTAHSLLVSQDAGQTWAVAGLSKGALSVVRLDDLWFAGGPSGVFKSQDLTTWTECSAGIPHPGIRSLAATSTGDLLALTYMGIFRSLDRCGSWWLLAELPRPDLPWRIVASGPDVGIVLAGRGIAQWSFVERRWNTSTTAPEITAVAHDPAGAHWVGTPDGVYEFVTRADSWELLRAGLEGRRVTALTFHPDGYLLAGVAGSGTFRARLRQP